MNRRQFAQFLGLTSLTGTCFAGVNIRDALAQSQATNKPLLSEKSLSDLMSGPNNRQLAAEAKKNLKTFLNNHFHLMDEQKKLIGSLTDQDLRNLGKVADKVAAGRGGHATFRFTESGQGAKGPNRISVAMAPATAPSNARAPDPTINFNFNFTFNRA